MTKKDYELIANALIEGRFYHNDVIRAGSHRDYYIGSEEMFHEIVKTMALYLAEDNPHFNKTKFIQYIAKAA
jgi:hypothetical protein